MDQSGQERAKCVGPWKFKLLFTESVRVRGTGSRHVTVTVMVTSEWS
jgi:hypothetical protein